MTNPKLDVIASRLRDLKGYLEQQFPAAIGHVPLHDVYEDIDSILTALSSLEAENGKLREDKAMLDWLEKQPTLALWQGSFADSEYNIKLGRVGAPIATISTMDADGEQSEHDDIGHGGSFREAIRNAMKGANE